MGVLSMEEPTPEQRLTTATTNFAQTLLSAGCPVEFICTQAFKYAMVYQYQVDSGLEFMQSVMKGVEASYPEAENTVYMDKSAQILVKVVTTLRIHPKQLRRE